MTPKELGDQPAFPLVKVTLPEGTENKQLYEQVLASRLGPELLKAHVEAQVKELLEGKESNG
jgi:hypothetical protein